MNHSELVTAIKAYADRPLDAEVNASMDMFITMAEARINRLLKTRKQTTRAFTPTKADEEYYPLPPDYAGLRSVKLTSELPTTGKYSSKVYKYVTPVNFDELNGTSDLSMYYTIVDDQIRVHPRTSTDQSIELVYFQKVPHLSNISNTNWLSEEYPDIYLSAVMVEIESFAKNVEAAKEWAARFMDSITELDNSDFHESWGGTPLCTVLINT